jgi:hypothetical protein
MARVIPGEYIRVSDGRSLMPHYVEQLDKSIQAFYAESLVLPMPNIDRMRRLRDDVDRLSDSIIMAARDVRRGAAEVMERLELKNSVR